MIVSIGEMYEMGACVVRRAVAGKPGMTTRSRSLNAKGMTAQETG